MSHSSITRVLHTRWMLLIAAILAAIGALIAYMPANNGAMVASTGLVAGWGDSLCLNPEICLGICWALNAAVTALMLNLSKVYNLLRGMSRINGSAFLIFQLATPWLLCEANPGVLLCLVLLCCMAMMFSLYGQEQCDMRKVFLVFALLSACASFCYAYIIYIPIFVLACLQLKVFSLRCALATVIGICTPWVIFFGLGLVSVDDLQMPFDALSFPGFGTSKAAMLAVTVLLTSFVAVGAWAQNVMKIITYKANSRQMLSVVTTLTLVTVVASLLDMAHISYYLTMLNCCAAFQFAHLFVAIHNFAKSYLLIIGVFVIYLSLYVCNLLI